MIKMSNKSSLLTQKRLPEKMLKNQDATTIQQKCDGRKFLETFDCAKILNHKNMCHCVSTWKKKMAKKSKEYYIKRKICLRNIFSKIKIDFVILDQKCWNSQKWAICVKNSQKSLYSWENIRFLLKVETVFFLRKEGGGVKKK